MSYPSQRREAAVGDIDQHRRTLRNADHLSNLASSRVDHNDGAPLARLPTIVAGRFVHSTMKQYHRFLRAIDRIEAHSAHHDHHDTVLTLDVHLNESPSAIFATSLDILGLPHPESTPIPPSSATVIPIQRSFHDVNGLFALIRHQTHACPPRHVVHVRACDFCDGIREVMRGTHWPYTWWQVFTTEKRKQDVTEAFLNGIVQVTQRKHSGTIGESICRGCEEVPMEIAQFFLPPDANVWGVFGFSNKAQLALDECCWSHPPAAASSCE